MPGLTQRFHRFDKVGFGDRLNLDLQLSLGMLMLMLMLRRVIRPRRSSSSLAESENDSLPLSRN